MHYVVCLSISLSEFMLILSLGESLHTYHEHMMWVGCSPTVCRALLHVNSLMLISSVAELAIFIVFISSPLDAKLFQCGNTPSAIGGQSIPTISLNCIFRPHSP